MLKSKKNATKSLLLAIATLLLVANIWTNPIIAIAGQVGQPYYYGVPLDYNRPPDDWPLR